MNKLCIKLIKAYQNNKNPNVKKCRYIPSCSNYALGCYEKFNFFYASLLTLWRLLRCNPFSKGGFDPVPMSRKEKKAMKEKYDATIKPLK